MPQTPKTITILDVLLLVALLCTGIAFFPILQSHKPTTVLVFHDNKVIARYPISEQKKFSVHGSIGAMTLSISNSKVSVISSTCLRGICTHSGAISHSGQQIVCAPNHILITLESSSESTLDGITQ